jgi:hypothetical protein
MEQSCDKLNDFTLSIMSNRNKYDKYKKSIESISLEEAANETFRKEKMYYKDRILHMTRDLFHERCENDDINRAHHEYMKSCIEYLKWNDITDMIEEDTRSEVRADDNDNINSKQAELRDKIEMTATMPHDDDDNERCEVVDEEETPSPPSPPSGSVTTSSLLSIANKMCIRKKTIDDFIVLKPTNNIPKFPKVRDYHSEIMKRADAADAATD